MTETKQTFERTRRRSAGWTTLAQGEPMIWLTGGALLLCLGMIISLLAFVLVRGMSTFWPQPLVQVETLDGRMFLGEVTQDEVFEPVETDFASLPTPEARADAQAEIAAEGGKAERRLMRTGNFDVSGTHFNWLSNFEIKEESQPEWAILIERQSWGRFYGYPMTFELAGETVADTPEGVWAAYNEHHASVRERWRARQQLETDDIGKVNKRIEAARLAERRAELEYGGHSSQAEDAQARSLVVEEESKAAIAEISEKIKALNDENAKYRMKLKTADGKEITLALADIVRVVPSNQLGLMSKLGVYTSRWWEFLSGEPREANSEGGVFPAIFGTVLMTILMSIAVVPYGVMTALYLKEYAKAGPIVSAVRIAINNLAGVPSIVFGVFGLGFFCYGFGSFIDAGPAAPWPIAWWFAALGVTALFVAAAIGLGYATSGPPGSQTAWQRRLRHAVAFLWLAATVMVIFLVFDAPFFHGFYRAQLPNPTFGKGAMLWASLTLALLTLPVVIVSTEEALSAVPNSMREGSYACGASKWQTIRRIVLPRALPGIMTGMILAIARGAGEVAPLMLVGAVKLAPELPFDWTPPFGMNRSFMHLGFHIYDLGFQSQNSEAAKPMVFTTTLLLILIIASLTMAAINIRTRLRRKFVGNKF